VEGVRRYCVSHEKRWVDNSLRNLTGDWLRRVEERFVGVNGGVKSLQNFSSLDDPLPFVKRFFEAYPLAAEQLLAARIYHLCTYPYTTYSESLILDFLLFFTWLYSFLLGDKT
jgi:enoyl reductase-like protein